MRKIIGNLIYDTDRSTLLAEVKIINEGEIKTLYRTSSGRFFMLTEVLGYHEPHFHFAPTSPDDAITFLEAHRDFIGADAVDDLYLTHFDEHIAEA